MYKDDIKELNKWIKQHKSYGTYHHTKQTHGEELYSISLYDVSDFSDFLRETFPDLIGIPCMIGNDGIWFTKDDVEKARFY